MSDQLIGFVVLALGCWFVVAVVLEIYDAAVRWLRQREDRSRPWHDLSPEPTPNPEFHLGAYGFRVGGSESLLRQRHQRRLELEPRGSAGFAAFWRPHD